MPTSPYFLEDGTRVPGTTTIIGRFKESGALIGWAMKRTRELDIEAVQELGKSSDNKVTLVDACTAIATAKTARDQATGEADAGTICHQWIDDTAHGRKLTEFPDVTNDLVKMASNGLDAFNEWWRQNDFKVAQSETPLVSHEHRYGGTLDMLAHDRDGNLCMLDWKCANAIYGNQYIPQLGAYSWLVHENGIGKVTKFHLFRASKNDGSGHHHQWPAETVGKGWELFKLYRQAYDLAKDLERK